MIEKSLIVLTACILSSCTAETLPKNYLNVDYNMPFGLSWNPSPTDIAELAKIAKETCEKWSGRDKDSLAKNDEDPSIFLKQCLTDSNYTIHLPLPELSQNPTDHTLEGVSLTAIDLSAPVAMTYHYNHNISHSANDVDIQKKRAKVLRQKLVAQYGKPVSRGHFSESRRGGYAKSKWPAATCDFWVQETVGIFLCSQRVIYMDGLEMSLEFIRLDRFPDGDVIFREIAPSLQSKPEHAKILSRENSVHVPVEPTQQDREFATLMSGDWLNSSKFGTCKKDSLFPLEKRIEETQDLAVVYIDITNTYSGETLADYAFEHASALENRVSNARQGDVLLLLLSKAAESGSAAGYNELGNGQLYCSFGIEQDLEAARQLYARAVEGGSPHAMWNLAHLHLAGLTPSKTSQEDATALLENCREAGLEDCDALLDYIQMQ